MLQNYLKIAWRNVSAQKTYALLNILGLAVGLAGGLLIFVFLRYHLRTDRYHTDVDRIVRLSTDLHLEDGSIDYKAEGPPPMAKLLRTHYPQVEQAAFLLGMRDINVGVTQPGQRVPVHFLERDGIGFVEPEWMEMLTYTWLQGNPETALRAPNRAVLTQSWAKRYFGATNALGQTLTLDNKAVVTVSGVVADPPGPTDTPLGLLVSLSTVHQLGVPAGLENDWGALNPANRVYARLKNPAALPSLQRAMPALSRKHYGQSASIYQFVVQPMADWHFDPVRDPVHAIQPYLLWGLGIVGLLLLGVACVNFINLATAQALRRRKEVGIRKTLGSSRGQLVRQFLLETALITGIAGLLAIGLTYGVLPIFGRWVHLKLSLPVDGLTIGFVLALLLSVLMLAGAYPARVLSGIAPWAALRHKAPSSGRGRRVRHGLIITQFVVCQGLMLGALVVVHQMRYMQEAKLGFQKDNVLLVDLPYEQQARQEAFKQKVGALARVRSVSLSVLAPASKLSYSGSFKVDGQPDWVTYPVVDRLADADYLTTYGLTLLAGRSITPGDTIRDYVINETLLHKLGFQQPEQALGHRLQYYLSAVPLPIVGVVKDFHQQSLRHPVSPCLIANWPAWYRQAGIRLASANPTQTIQAIRQIWHQIFPDEVFQYQFLDNQVANLYETETLLVQLINVFTGLAILISCLGLYGLVLHTVAQRTKEVGIRKVLGASVGSLMALLTKEYLKLACLALLIATPLSGWVMSRWLADFTYRIQLAWWMVGLTGLLALMIVLLTVSLQTGKAALANPTQSLRLD